MKRNMFWFTVLGTLVINGCGGGGGSPQEIVNTPSALHTSQDVGIEKAKTVLKDLRAQAYSLIGDKNSSTSGYVNKEAENINHALESCSLKANDATMMLARYIAQDTNVTNEDWGEDGNFTRVCNTQDSIVKCSYEHQHQNTIYKGYFEYVDNADDVNMSDFDEIHMVLHGTVPADSYRETETFDLNITMEKTDFGADMQLKNISLANDNTQLAISDLRVSAFYENKLDEEGAYYQFHSIGFNGRCYNYEAMGLFKITDYVQNETLLNGENENWLPSAYSFEGSIKNTAQHSEISGLISAVLKNASTVTKEGEKEYDVKVNGLMDVPERPKINVALTYNNAVDTEETYHHFTVDYNYGTMSINVQGVMDKEEENGNVTITSGDGVKFYIVIVGGDVVEGDPDTGTGSIVTYNGKLIGTLEYRSSIVVVKYIDGSFESLP